MGPDGDILLSDEIKKKPISEQKKYIGIPDNMLLEVTGMNRAQRRAWYKRNKKGIEKEGVDTDEQI